MTGPWAGAASRGSPAKRIKRWAVAGLAAQVLFTLGWVLADRWQGPGYSSIRYTISDETALGAPHAWFLITCQLLAPLPGRYNLAARRACSRGRR